MRDLRSVLVGVGLLALVGCGGSDSTSDSGLGGSGGTSTGGTGGDGGATGGVAGVGNAGGTGGSAGAGAVGGGGSGGSTTSSIQTVFIILMENHSWSTIKGSPSAKYINETLVPAGGHTEQYFTPPKNHPSLPNYIWLEAGDNLGIVDDNDPAQNHKATTDHLATQLKNAGVSWRAYAEDISGTNCPLAKQGLYDAKHTPQVYFDDVTETNNPNSPYCIEHVRPFSELADDLKNNTVARYNFLTPNECNNMHGDLLGAQCNPIGADLIKFGDDWLAQTIPMLTSSAAYTNNGVIFVLWDEGDEVLLQPASDGPIPLIILSPLAKTNYQNSIKYTHSSMLRSLEEIFGVPLLAGANNATDLADFFTSFP